jgi:hypothetical protein
LIIDFKSSFFVSSRWIGIQTLAILLIEWIMIRLTYLWQLFAVTPPPFWKANEMFIKWTCKFYDWFSVAYIHQNK